MVAAAGGGAVAGVHRIRCSGGRFGAQGGGEVEEETPSSMEASGRRFGAAEWLHAGEGRTTPLVVPNPAVRSPVSRAGKPRMKRSQRRTRRRGR